MQATFPWTIVARTNVTEGYNTTFCVRCTTTNTVGYQYLGDTIEQDNVVFTQHQATDWVMLTIIIAVVAVVVVGGLVGVISFMRGKAVGSTGVSEGAEMQASAPPKVVNKTADADAGQAQEIEDFHQNEMEISKKPNDADNGSDDAPASVASASFYQAGANTARPLQAEATEQ